MLDFRTDLAIQLAELDHADETFTVPLPFGGMTLDAVLETLTERPQAECIQKGEDAIYCQVNVQLKGGIDSLQWRKEPRPNFPVFSGNSAKILNCCFAGKLQKLLLVKEYRERHELLVLDVVVFHCIFNLVIPDTVVTVLQFLIHLHLIIL